MIAPPTPEELLHVMHSDIEQDNGIPPALIYLGAGDEITVAPCLDVGPIATLVALAMVGPLPRPDWIAMISDTYRYEGHEEPTEDLNDLFEQGDPRVMTALHASCLAPDGPTYAVTQAYARNPDGTVTWSEVVELVMDLENDPIAVAMRLVLTPRGTNGYHQPGH